MESISGEAYRPHHSRSSPVFTMMVSSSGATICRSPSMNLAPPVPPVRTVIMLPSVFERSRYYLPQCRVARPADRCGRLLDLRTQDKPAGAGATQILWPRFVAVIGPDAARVFQD